MATMNRINISLIFLIMISMVLPTSAFMYASGSTEDSSDGASDSGSTEDSSDGASDSGSTEDSSDGASDSGSIDDTTDSPPSELLPPNVDSSSSDGSIDDTTDSPPSELLPPNVDSSSSDGSIDSSITPTENNPTLPSESPLSNNTGNVQGEDLVSIILTLHNQERAAVGVPPLTWSDSLASHAQPWADKVYATGDASHSSGLADFGNYGENMARGGGPSVATPSWLAQTWADEKSRYGPGHPMV